MLKGRLSRRAFLSASGAMGLLMLGCKKSLVCPSPGALSQHDRDERQGVGYVELATDPAKACSKCTQWVPSDPERCGGCKLVRGEIHPDATCRLFIRVG